MPILNPDEIIICGSISDAGQIIAEEMNSTFDKTLLPKTRSDLGVLISPYKGKESLLGAAVLIFDELFNSPALSFPGNIKVDKH